MDVLDTEDGFSTTESPCPNADDVLKKTPSFSSSGENNSLRVSSIGSGSSGGWGARMEWVSPAAHIPRFCVHSEACASHSAVSADNEEAPDFAGVVVRSSRRPIPGALAAQQITRRHVSTRLRPLLSTSATWVWMQGRTSGISATYT
jgi:hypothetical protein